MNNLKLLATYDEYNTDEVTLNVDLSKYKILAVTFRSSSPTGGETGATFVLKGLASHNHYLLNFGKSGEVICRKSITTTDTSITFGKTTYNKDNTVSSPNYFSPYNIYGVL